MQWSDTRPHARVHRSSGALFARGYSFADVLSTFVALPCTVRLLSPCDAPLTVHRNSSSCSRSAGRCWWP
jgi:hypothetical protein